MFYDFGYMTELVILVGVSMLFYVHALLICITILFLKIVNKFINIIGSKSTLLTVRGYS